MWQKKLLEGIKQNKNRMLIAMEIGVPVHNISKEALRMIYSHEYRKAGITDRQFAMWFDASLIGLQTVEMLLRRIYSESVKEYRLDRPQNGGRNCLNCKRRGTFVCSHYNNNDNGTYAIVCKNYRR